MEYAMTKRTLDTFGGVGSMLASLVCIRFAMMHHENESIWKVWVAFAVLLLLNGIAMVLYARRSKRTLQRQGA